MHCQGNPQSMTVTGMVRREASKLCLTATMLITILVLSLCQHVVFAQSATTGSINGTVVDSSGAVVPGASITITDLATRDQRVLTSNEEGRFTVPFLKRDGFETGNCSGLQSTKTTIPGFDRSAVSRQHDISPQRHHP